MGWPRDGSSFPEPTWWNGDPPPSQDPERDGDDELALVYAALDLHRAALRGLVGLVNLLLTRTDLPAEVREALESNHRVIEVRKVMEGNNGSQDA